MHAPYRVDRSPRWLSVSPATGDPYAAHWARRRRHARLDVALFVAAPALAVPFVVLAASVSQALIGLASAIVLPFLWLPRGTLPCPRCKTDFPVIGMFQPSEARVCPGCGLAAESPGVAAEAEESEAR
jgi:hypothetical protein